MNYLFLKNTVLFHNMSQAEIESAINGLKTHQSIYKKNDIIFHTGEVTTSLGIVLKGSVNIENIDLWGNKSIIANADIGEIFAETYAFTVNEPLMVDVSANDTTEILFINTQDLFKHQCNFTKIWYKKFVKNLMTAYSQKNLYLSRRIFLITAKTIRERLLSYLSSQAVIKNSNSFSIPFNRQQLADYLNVDRSALSNELGKMKKDGILDFYKNNFVLFTNRNI